MSILTLNDEDSTNTMVRPALGDLTKALEVVDTLRESCRQRVHGRDDVIDLIVTAVLADGHVLLEDHPGSGKTTLANALGASIAPSGEIAPFRRVQFTPDLLPSDVTGVTVFDPDRSAFSFRPGPVFANVLLADEINRTSPKVQAALLEAMAEKQVTVDNETHSLQELFFVIATQNPLDLMGTYPLPKAQLDRFVFKIVMKHLDRDTELEVLMRHGSSAAPAEPVNPVSVADVITARRGVRDGVLVSRAIRECLVDVAHALREDPRVLNGVSTRSLVIAIPALQAHAMISERDYVSADDVKALLVPLFAHRVDLAAGTDNAAAVVETCALPLIERVTRRSLRR